MTRHRLNLVLPVFFLFTALLCPGLLCGSAGAQTNLAALGLKMSAPTEVVPFTVMGRNAFCYELVVEDLSKLGKRLESVEILADGPDGTTLKSYTGATLTQSLRRPGAGIFDDVVFVFIRQPFKAPVPESLFHRIRYRDAKSGEAMILEGAPVLMKAKTAIVLKPPFTGKDWIVWEAVSNPLSHHRKALLEYGGKTFLSQRYAIDWAKFGPNGNLFKTDGKTNADYYCYGEPLLAAADGVVVDARDGIPENIPDPTGAGKMAVSITFGTVGGNYVVLKLADGVYAHYCHMIPGSLQVKIGDQVTAGDVLGKLGNSGNSDAPHLHLHISNSPDLLLSDGLPYVFESYVLEGIIKSLDAPWTPDPAKEKTFTDNYPLNLSVVAFGSQGSGN